MSAGENTKHTPGPWVATPSDPAEGVECIWITACPAPNQEKEIAAVYGPQNEKNKATAALIAAAPEMRDAIKEKLASDDAMLAFILNARPSELGEEEWGRQHKNRCDRGRAATQALRAALTKAGV